MVLILMTFPVVYADNYLRHFRILNFLLLRSPFHLLQWIILVPFHIPSISRLLSFILDIWHACVIKICTILLFSLFFNTSVNSRRIEMKSFPSEGARAAIVHWPSVISTRCFVVLTLECCSGARSKQVGMASQCGAGSVWRRTDHLFAVTET